MRRLELPEGPAESLGRFVEATREWLSPGSYRLGGGTALAGRWRHRHSTDIDLFIDERTLREALRRGGLAVRESLRALTTGRSERYEVGIDYIEVQLESGPVSVMTLPPRLDDPPSEDSAGTTRVALETTAEIIARKLHHRVIRDGRYAPRDFYDFVCARRYDQEAWRRATEAVTVTQWHTIRYAVAHLGERWGHGDEAILEAADRDLARSLRTHATNLIDERAQAALRHHARDRGPTW